MWCLGCAQKDITPDFPVVLHGYNANDYCSGVAEPLSVGVLALSSGKKQVLLITVDSLGITMRDCRRFYPLIERWSGIAYPEIFIFSAHTHFAPNFSPYYVTRPGGKLPLGIMPPDERFFEFFSGKLQTAIGEALSTQEPVTLESAEIPLPSLHFNRRTIDRQTGKCVTNFLYPEHPERFIFPPVDSMMSVWRFRKNNGIVKAILARYGCHPVTGGDDNNAISADYPGYFRRYIGEIFGCPGFFFQGNAGDVVPVRRRDGSRAAIGEIMARSIFLAEPLFRRTDDPALSTKVIEIQAKLNCFPPGYNRGNAEERWRKALSRAGTSECEDGELAAESFRHRAAVLYPEDVVPIPLQGLRLGDRAVIGVPFEVVSEIGLKLRRACPRAVMATVTGGYERYLPTAGDFEKGGFETERGADFAPETGDKVAEAAILLVREIFS